MNDHARTFVLRTLGHPVLLDPDGRPVGGLRRKDLALLAYLCVERPRPHSRARLAALLWGESRDANARHSLTQTLGRIRRASGGNALVVEREQVRSTGAVECDAEWLLSGHERLDPLLTPYDGPFLEGFEAGFGLEEFDAWAGGRRAELRNAAVRWLERAGAEAEAVEDWALALRIGERGTQVDPVSEQAHRRVMRALFESGERNRALRHAAELEQWLADEVGGVPDPETQELVARIRAAQPEAPAPVPPPPASPPSPSPPAPQSPIEPDPPAELPIEAAGEIDAAPSRPEPVDPTPAVPLNVEASEVEPVEHVPTASESAESIADGDPAPRTEPADPTWRGRLRWLSGDVRRKLSVGILAAVALWAATEASWGVGPPEPPPGHGESIRQGNRGAVYLAYAETLWRYPDEATLNRCMGGWRERVRRVRGLPTWPRRTLASVTAHPWMGETSPVHTDHPQQATQFVTVGCVLGPIPDPSTFEAIFGHTDWSQSRVAPDSLIRASPRTGEAHAFPVRRSGMLIRGTGPGVRWIVFHGGALAVEPGVLATYCRTPAEAVLVSDAEFAYYRAFAALPPADPPCDPGRRPCSAAIIARDSTPWQCDSRTRDHVGTPPQRP